MSKRRSKVRPGDNSPESQLTSIAVTVCGALSSLASARVCPGTIVIVAGSSREPAIRIDLPAGAVGAAP